MPLKSAGDCLCRSCLVEAIAASLTEYLAQASQAEALALGAKHSLDPVVEGIDYIVDDLGRMIFTAWHHLKRGGCCKSGCKNCPY